jgi:hypothetical protein
MTKKKYKFKTKMWLYPGMAGWHFLSVPREASREIKEKSYKQKRRGWGSVAVTATIGEVTWKTSIFPDKKSSCYIMPVKAEVRKKEGIYERDVVEWSVDV